MNTVKKVIAGVALTAAVAGGIIVATQPKQITIDITSSYELNNLGDQRHDGGALLQLQDGITDVVPQPGYGKVISAQDEFYIPVNDSITDVKLYSFQGSGPAWQLYAWNNGKETLLASFTGGQYQKWIDYPVSARATKLHIISHGYWPTEWLLNGFDYSTNKTTNSVTNTVPHDIYFNNQLGVNIQPWSWGKNDNSGNLIDGVVNHFAPFTAERLYVTWNLIEQKAGLNTFNPSHSGGWPFDTILYAIKNKGDIAIFDIKEQSPAMLATWPVNLQRGENIPVMYANLTKLSDPASYKEQARVAFQIGARYGSVKWPNSALTIDQSQRWNGDPINQLRSGTGLVKYIECDNERDKYWFGLNAYQTALQYAANMSAFYDADQGRLGAGYGVKTADKNLQVVIGGICNVSLDYLNGMVDYCNMHRGGSLCWDVINYHLYAGRQQPENNIDYDLSPIVKEARREGKEFWLTEVGYDISPGSPYAAPSENMRANWVLRTSLLCARIGIDRTFFYQDYNDGSGDTPYATSGLLTATGRTQAADYLLEAKNLMVGYKFVTTQKIGNGIMDTYTNGKQTVYVGFLATSTGATAKYHLPAKCKMFQPIIGASIMKETDNVTDAIISECPAFFVRQ